MKKLFAVLAAVMMVMSFASCGKSSYEVSQYDIAKTNDQVRMFIKQKTVTDETDKVAVTLENLMDTAYTYDAMQRLEVWQDSHWCVVPDMQEAVTLEIYTLPANGSDDIFFNFQKHYDKLPDGWYRMVKSLVDGDGNIALATAEFGIGRARKE